MSIRVIGVGEYVYSDFQELRSNLLYGGVTYEEHIASASDIKVHDSDNMAIIIALDNYNVAVDIARLFYQRGVLTIGLSDKKIEENGCFDAQHLYRSYNICGIVDALIRPIVIPSQNSFDFNDISAAMKDAGNYTTFFAYDESIDNLINKIKFQKSHLCMEHFKSACISLYFNPASTIAKDEIAKVKGLFDIMPADCNTVFGFYHDSTLKPNSFELSIIITGIPMNGFYFKMGKS